MARLEMAEHDRLSSQHEPGSPLFFQLNLQIIITVAKSRVSMPNENDLQQRPAEIHCGECGGSGPRRDGDLLRCECGSLLARLVAGRVELKCRRCKRTVTLMLDQTSERRMG